MKKLMMIPLLALAACTQNNVAETLKVDAANKSQIINGENVTASEAYAESTVALLGRNPRDGSVVPYCTGTLISRNLVVTASHCTQMLERVQTKIFFGTELPDSFEHANAIEIEEAISHRDFGVNSRTERSEYDVAVIKLVSDAPEGFKPVAILNNVKTLKAGMPMTLVGWGRMSETENIKTVTMQKTVVEIAQVRDQEVVTDQTRGSGACNGDSGGPGFIETSFGLILAGATRGPESGYEDCHHYGNYTLLVNYKDFLNYAAQSMEAEYPQFVNY
ncbi:S1 family peptidase [Bdellovibrio sp. HCB288]|uniref:S1 family peptidase n=1 Tax=Bdellovibrio sp. HCB288 TaxID=3394355 RepID=UPI0039B3FECE